MRGVPRWLIRYGVVAIVAVIVGVLTAGLPAEPDRRAAALVLLVLAAAGWLSALRPRSTRMSAVLLVGTGLAGAALDVLQPHGPAFVIGYMAMAGLALRLPRRLAFATGVVVLAAVAAAQAATSARPLAAAINIGLGAGFLFAAGSFAAISRAARETAEALLAQEAATRAAREEAAALAERTRLARELHDVLAHTLSGLAVQLEGARLLAGATGADPRLAEQVTRAQALARDGMGNAKRAVSALRGDALPGPALLPQLVSEVRATAGIPVTLTVSGAVRPLVPEAGLAVYRTVQEALTNTAKYAGRGASARVNVSWTDDGVAVEIVDNGDGATPTAVSGGFGLTGVAERAALLGGHAEAGPVDGGFRVHLRLPLVPSPPRPDQQESLT
jgi:signal transduction histidine kinase